MDKKIKNKVEKIVGDFFKKAGIEISCEVGELEDGNGVYGILLSGSSLLLRAFLIRSCFYLI